MITIHTIVRNEGRFVKAALMSALATSAVKRALVWDTGSSDDTPAQILSIGDRRIEFQQRGKADRLSLVRLRKEQLKITKTPWFMLVDGDEIWPGENLRRLTSTMNQCGPETIALVNRTRNAAGDIYHYLPESEGHYKVGPWSGHINIRAIRNVLGLTVKGEYPSEWYEFNGKKIQDFPECSNPESPGYCLEFVDTWYLHMTHLTRSRNWLSELFTIDRLKKHRWFYSLTGGKLLKMREAELPQPLKKYVNNR